MSERPPWATSVGALLACLLVGCTRAPAPCAADVDCVAARCVNGACVVDDLRLDRGPLTDAGPGLDRGAEPTDRGALDAAPLIDAQPGCEQVRLSVEADVDAVEVRRDEPVELLVDASSGAMITYASSAGGAFVLQPSGALWIARDDVDWPWQTDRVSLTVTAELDGCRVQRRVQVTLLGDVLIGDVISGRLDVIGSNGTRFGQWRLIDQTGITAMVRLPDGGFVVAVRGAQDPESRVYDAQLVRLDAAGREVLRFATVDLMDAPLFTRPIEHLYVQGDRVVAANASDPTIRWFDFDGVLQRSVPGGGSWIQALAPQGDSVVFSRDRESRVFTLEGDTPRQIADADGAVYGLFPLRADSTLMALEANQSELARLSADGQVRAVPALPPNYSVDALTPFDEGYLALSQRNGRVIEFDADMTAVEGFEFAVTGADNPRAILWLHTD